MDESTVITFYKDLHFIFCVCPCCGQIFSLSEANIKIKRRPLPVPKYEVIIEKQRLVDRETEKTESVEEKYQDRLESLEMRQEAFADVEPIVIRKVKHQGRRQAMAKVKKVDKIFLRRRIDPRDVRLLFSPIDFVCFPGMTEHKEVESINFLTHKPLSRQEEKTVGSIRGAIQKGNVEFVLARIGDTGKVDYVRNGAGS